MSWYVGVIFIVWTCVCVIIGYMIRGCCVVRNEKTAQDTSTQCKIPSMDIEEIEKMTIQSIREELRVYHGAETGNKRQLAERLKWFREKVTEE